MNTMILIFSRQISNRLRYTCSLLFTSILNIEFDITNSEAEFNSFEGAKINYSELNHPHELQIKPSKLLFEEGFKKQKIELKSWRTLPVFFETQADAELPFDLFAMAFFLASRYEEYDPNQKLDKHGRFKAEESLAYQSGFHMKPLINQLCFEFKLLLLAKFQNLNFKESKYQFKPTFDIDTAFDYLGKGVYRTLGAYGRDLLHLNFHKIKERTLVLAGKQNDPFDNFKFIIEVLKEHDLESQFFVNMGDYGLYDKKTSLTYPLFRARLQEINEITNLDIHPSYKSNEDMLILKKEVESLEDIIRKKTTRSRQHYLKMKLPDTYQNIIKLGIKEDYSMGYASQLGFRASLCTPFKFYDLLNEEETDLKIFPFCFMDGTYTDSLRLNYDEILKVTSAMHEEVKKLNGLMMGIWHNSFISDNEETKALFKDVLTLCK